MTILRVVHVVEATFAGVGRHVLDLADWQCAKGYDVEVVYSTSREDTAFAQRRETIGISVLWHAVATRNRPCLADRAIVRLLDELTGTGPVIVHGHSTKGGLLARALPALRGRAIVYTPNAFYSMNPGLPALLRIAVGLLERALAKRTDAIVTVSPEETLHARTLGIDVDKLHLIPNGIPPISRVERSIACAELGLDPALPIVGFVGRFDEQKAPLSLVRICLRVAAEIATAQFVLIGEGPLRCEATRIAKDSPHGDRFFFPGRRDGQRAMFAFDVFLLPSWYEGFPYVLIEAALAGVPIVTTDTASAGEIVEDGVTGYRHAAGDIQSLSGSVLKLLGDVEHRESAREVLTATAQRYSLDRMGEDIDALYRNHHMCSVASASSTSRET